MKTKNDIALRKNQQMEINFQVVDVKSLRTMDFISSIHAILLEGQRKEELI